MDRARRGFTLVELMVVVAIIGVLAALAIVGFQRYSASAGSGEAISMLNNLRMAQESFRAENLRYNNCSATAGAIVAADYYPRDPTGTLTNQKVMWGPASTNTGVLGCFNAMGFRAGGAVRYNFATTAGAPGGTLGGIAGRTTNNVGPPPGLNPSPATDPWYVAAAVANLRGAAGDGAKSFVWISSQSTEAYVGSDSD